MYDHIGQIPAEAAAKFANKQALVFEEQVFSFNELYMLIEKVAGGLNKLGIEKGDTVTIYAVNSWQWIVSYFAIARLGAVINPVNTMLTNDEVEYVVNDCGSKVILVSAEKVADILNIPDKSKVQAIVSFGNGIDRLHSAFKFFNFFNTHHIF